MMIHEEKVSAKHQGGHDVQSRDPNVSINAFSHAGYKCEIDAAHPTFIRRTNDLPYTGPHHLVSMGFSKEFDVLLFVEEKVVSLCGNCHNVLHYGSKLSQIIRLYYVKEVYTRKSFLSVWLILATFLMML